MQNEYKTWANPAIKSKLELIEMKLEEIPMNPMSKREEQGHTFFDQSDMISKDSQETKSGSSDRRNYLRGGN